MTSTPRWDGLRQVVTSHQPAGTSSVVDAHRAAVGWAQFAIEMDRSRRHERPLALGALDVDAGRRGLYRGAVLTSAASTVRTQDVLWVDGSHVFLAMPETGREAAVAVLTRVARIVTPDAVNDWRLAIFPDDAFTVDALIRQLRDGIPGGPVPADSK